MIITCENDEYLMNLLFYNIAGRFITKCVPDNTGTNYLCSFVDLTNIRKNNSETVDDPDENTDAVFFYMKPDNEGDDPEMLYSIMRNKDTITVSPTGIDDRLSIEIKLEKGCVDYKATTNFTDGSLPKEKQKSAEYILHVVVKCISEIIRKFQ